MQGLLTISKIQKKDSNAFSILMAFPNIIEWMNKIKFVEGFSTELSASSHCKYS